MTVWGGDMTNVDDARGARGGPEGRKGRTAPVAPGGRGGAGSPGGPGEDGGRVGAGRREDPATSLVTLPRAGRWLAALAAALVVACVAVVSAGTARADTIDGAI